jgi:hypothetical protein
MAYELKGTILKIYETVQVSERFSKREFAVEYADNPKYPQQVKLQVTGDKCAQLDELDVGDEVSIAFNVRGREYTNKKTGEVDYFTNLDAWKIERVGEKKQTRTSGYMGGGNDRRESEPKPGEPDLDIPF